MGFFEKLKNGLSKTKTAIVGKIDNLFKKFRKVDEELFDELEELLICADIGVETTEEILDELRENVKENKIREPEDVKAALMEMLREMIGEHEPLNLSTKPSVILVIGVNGVGKTTSIGKMAARLSRNGKKVVVAAADTFRAAAVEQLDIWGERVGCPVIKQKMGADPASVAYDTLASAKANKADVVIIDTAGRLHNKIGLMNELTKIRNVMQKLVPDAPHEVLLVLDGSTGQNAFEQAKQFTKATQITALAVTKLDGTAKGGVVIGISDQFKIPVKYIGLGEKIDDLQLFDKTAYVNTLLGKL